MHKLSKYVSFAPLIAIIFLSNVTFGQTAWWEPENPAQGDSVTIYYNASLGTIPGSEWINLHWGINGWHEPPENLWPEGSSSWGDGAAIESPMTSIGNNLWKIALATDTTVETIDFCFHSDRGWDNNNYQDWHIYFGAAPAFLPVEFVLDTRSSYFSYTGSEITSVNLAGTFNGWSMTATPMTESRPGIWTVTLNLAEGTYEYKFVINNSVWVTDPDNPNLIGDFQNAVLEVIKDPRPRFRVESPEDGSVLYDQNSVEISAFVEKGDDGIGIDPTTIVVTLDGDTINHSYNSLTQEITYLAAGLSTGLHLLTFSVKDSAGIASLDKKVSFGIYSSGTGYHFVDSFEDDKGDGDYTYPAGVPNHSCDIKAITITATTNYDSLHFEIELEDVTDYTKVGIQINSSSEGVMAEAIPGIETKSLDWDGAGVFLSIMDPSSPYFDGTTDNRIYICKDPLITADSILVNEDASTTNKFEFNVSLASLEQIMGNYVEWYYTVFSYIDNSVIENSWEVSSAEGGIDDSIDPDIYDALFIESSELQNKLLRNYIVYGELGGPRMAALDAIGRGITSIAAAEIDSNLRSLGPIVRILTRSAEVLSPIQLIGGTISDTTITTATLTLNGVDSTISVTNGLFEAYVNLIEGTNTIRVSAVNDAGYIGYSAPINLTLIVDHTPKAIIDTVIVGESTVTVDGSASYDPDGDELSYFWYGDASNPELLVFEDPNAPVTSFNIPSTLGEYYFDLIVRDTAQNTSHARSFIIVDSSGVRATTINDNAQWVKDAIIYEIYVRSFSEQGTFNGVTEKMADIADLGVNCIWFMPINESAYENGYSVTNYYEIEPDYGTLHDFQVMLNAAKFYGIKVIIDHVVNHCSNQHPWMLDVQSFIPEFRKYSHYYDYFMWDANGNYRWTAGADLPDLNYANEELKNYLINMADYWIDNFSISGFRCDMAWAVEGRDHEYWRRWRQELKRIKPEVLLLAEASATDFTYFDKRFDAAYDWRLHHESAHSLANIFKGTPNINGLHQLITNYGVAFPENAYPLRFMENHDEARYISYNTVEQTKLVAALLLTIPGIPLIYAGQEVGELTLRDKIDWTDPYNLRPYYKKLIHIRNEYSCLRNKEIKRISCSNNLVYAYYRHNSESTVIPVLNFANTQVTPILNIPINDLGINPDSLYYMNDVLNEVSYPVVGSALDSFQVSLSPYQARIFVLSGTMLYVGTKEKTPTLLPKIYKLAQNYPNPFNSNTVISYQLPVTSEISLKIYNIAGQEVRALVDTRQKPGYYKIVWDGRDNNGNSVNSGIYFCRIEVQTSLGTKDYIETRKMILVH